MVNLAPLVDAHLTAARASERGRSAELVVHDGPLRQSVIALLSGTELHEHEAPPAASIQVLTGTVRVTEADEEPRALVTGDLWTLTHARHAVVADEDSAFLLTTVTGV
ncbi:hypothetical protein Xcel_2641 [Xylanimonas cellulosilytica DSM 15894]|uniref:Cupin 2 conserved barrel domain protein n=1 Tax=Xylanimonas cellulosilytica (strain DSM 15894 / JCM 12276 / CECT 5975 / KCTC 9989 / LMG 20990 / NBRC 107835 / XIL07) TaxID=446471 RepID=D1BX87_XYLCX|nr:hypothetical protein [Xylanimonas cellulosilytica]ACZ31655.1 hypothetical protein Xcel_2641 [Xylanimonas cellulosilytica DSM 15894]